MNRLYLVTVVFVMLLAGMCLGVSFVFFSSTLPFDHHGSIPIGAWIFFTCGLIGMVFAFILLLIISDEFRPGLLGGRRRLTDLPLGSYELIGLDRRSGEGQSAAVLLRSEAFPDGYWAGRIRDALIPATFTIVRDSSDDRFVLTPKEKE